MKNILPIAWLLLLGSCSSNLVQTSAPMHIVDGCRVYDLEGKLLKTVMSGLGICHLNEDGSYLISNLKGKLRFFSKDNNLIWEKDLMATHQINQTQNGDYLVMGSENHLMNGELVRFDHLYRFNQRGETVAEFSVFDHLDDMTAFIKNIPNQDVAGSVYYQMSLYRIKNQMINRFVRPLLPEEKEVFAADYETHHANSFYEIGNVSKNHPDLQRENLVFNLMEYFIITTPDMKKIVNIIPSPSPVVHDVHFLPDGNIFIYNNMTNYSNTKNFDVPAYSSVQIYSYPQMELLKTVGDRPEQRSFSAYCGGGSVLSNGDIIYSSLENGSNDGYINFYDHNSESIRKMLIGKSIDIKIFQQVKVRNMTQFLKNNKSI